MRKNRKSYNVYGMLLEIEDSFFISIQFAESLEEAFKQANLEFVRLNPDLKKDFMSSKIGLFTIKGLKEMIHEHKVFDSGKIENIVLKHRDVEKREEIKKKKIATKKVKLTKEEIKNRIMGEILKKKDLLMIKEHKSILTKNEIKYLEERIKNN